MSMLGSPNLHRGNAPLAVRLKIDELHAQLAPLDRYGVAGLSSAMTDGVRALFRGARASCFWAESERDSRIGEILIQPVGWAEASRRWQSRIRKICATG
jgi:hypothetical protein